MRQPPAARVRFVLKMLGPLLAWLGERLGVGRVAVVRISGGFHFGSPEGGRGPSRGVNPRDVDRVVLTAFVLFDPLRDPSAGLGHASLRTAPLSGPPCTPAWRHADNRYAPASLCSVLTRARHSSKARRSYALCSSAS